ncbi:copper(I)-binding protein [Sphingomonas sp. BE138]|uniref:copper chaperone PCu(A)C n=1 Tax=Sphingomonas sp. BE138 TaxID=2817845 RepID=UPI00285E7569|nr:copper chaperone PCu(A)C [Sphingomonas sp. BE138]MDR6787018.1 copper(I)-binding protein [Sphingomonas sp. BE138]
MDRRWTIAPLLLVAACSAQPPTPVAGEAYVRLAAVPGRPAGGYFVIRGGAKDATLIGVEAAGVARAELHGSRMTSNGMVTMESLRTVPVPARATVSFAPGGRHVMLFGMPATATPGATLPLTLRFADGQTTRADARVIAAGDVAPE